MRGQPLLGAMVRLREACVRPRKPISPGNRSGQNPAEPRCDSFATGGNVGLADAGAVQFAHLVRLKSRHYRPTQALGVLPVSSADLPRPGPAKQYSNPLGNGGELDSGECWTRVVRERV